MIPLEVCVTEEVLDAAEKLRIRGLGWGLYIVRGMGVEKDSQSGEPSQN